MYERHKNVTQNRASEKERERDKEELQSLRKRKCRRKHVERMREREGGKEGKGAKLQIFKNPFFFHFQRIEIVNKVNNKDKLIHLPCKVCPFMFANLRRKHLSLSNP